MNSILEERLCIKLKDVFASLLNTLYMNELDIPECILVFVFDYYEKHKNLYRIDLINRIWKEKVYEIDTREYSVIPMRKHKFENCEFWFGLKTGDSGKTLLQPLARNFFERMIKPLTRFF